MIRIIIYAGAILIFVSSGIKYGFWEILPVAGFILACVLVGEIGGIIAVKIRKKKQDRAVAQALKNNRDA